MVELDEPGVGRAPLLAVLEADVGDDVVAPADGRYGRLRGALRRGLKRHSRTSQGARGNPKALRCRVCLDLDEPGPDGAAPGGQRLGI